MVDWLGLTDVALAAFFVALAAVLLLRYQQASKRLAESAELNHDLWRATEDRLKKQDERILDMMGRLEVLQARVLAPAPSSPVFQSVRRDVTPAQHDMQQLLQPPRAPAPKPQTGTAGGPGETEMRILALLGGGAKSPIDIKEALDLSREHTARLMKALFDKGLVTRDDSAKPFVYQLTEEGRSYLEG